MLPSQPALGLPRHFLETRNFWESRHRPTTGARNMYKSCSLITIPIPNIEITKLKTNVSSVKNVEDLDKQVRIRRKNENMKNLQISGLIGSESEIKEQF